MTTILVPDLDSLKILNEREADHLKVVMAWEKASGRVFIFLTDEKPDTPYTTSFEVDPERAVEAFYHPWTFVGQLPGRDLDGTVTLTCVCADGGSCGCEGPCRCDCGGCFRASRPRTDINP